MSAAAQRGEKMKKYSYTKREVEILQSKKPIAITDEEFLAVYNKAFRRDHIHYILHLGDVYPEIEDRVFSDEFEEEHENLADRECQYLFPIFCPANRNTIGKIRNMTAYLLGTMDWTQIYMQRLNSLVPYRMVFNYWLDEYVRDYAEVPLWEDYFKGSKELSRMIELRGISGVDELGYRTWEYFERHVPKSLRGVLG